MLHIRQATEKDKTVIADFQMKMALETESLELNAKTCLNGVSAVFNDPKKGVYYVAEYHGRIIASAMVTSEWSDWRNQNFYWLQSVYVVPDYRRKGIFSNLYKHIQKRVENSNSIAGIRLYVDKANHAAQKTYSALGMDGSHYKTFEWIKNNQ